MPSNPICPPPMQNCWCCETGWPSMIYLTLTSTDCPSLNGVVVPLTASAGNNLCTSVYGGTPWVGQLNAGGCDFQVTANLHTNICQWLLNVSPCVPVVISISQNQVDCNWTSGSNTQRWDCACCSNGNVTATLSL